MQELEGQSSQLAAANLCIRSLLLLPHIAACIWSWVLHASMRARLPASDWSLHQAFNSVIKMLLQRPLEAWQFSSHRYGAKDSAVTNNCRAATNSPLLGGPAGREICLLLRAALMSLMACPRAACRDIAAMLRSAQRLVALHAWQVLAETMTTAVAAEVNLAWHVHLTTHRFHSRGRGGVKALHRALPRSIDVPNWCPRPV